MKNIKITRNPYLLFLPFLFLYAIIVLMLQNDAFWGDELRHFAQAKNLTHGFFAETIPYIEIRNGPGYPLMLFPFVALHVPLVLLKLLNAVFLYLSVVFLFKTLIQLVSFRLTLIFSFFWACYYNAFDFIFMLFAEVFTVFLVSLFVYFLVSAFNQSASVKSKKYIYLAGFMLGYIALTKMIFGYVLLCMLIGTAPLWIFNRKVVNYKKGLIIILVGFATVLPYLSYTYYLTGRVFYWGTSGGNNLYWMSGLEENDYGSWFPDPVYDSTKTGIPLIDPTSGAEKGGKLNLKNRTVYVLGAEDSLKVHHQKDYEEINKYKGMERDDAFKKIAISNIKENLIKYIKNCISNIGRIFFNYPYSYTPQKPGTLFRLPLNGIILVLMLFCIIPTCLNWRKLDYAIRIMIFISFLYLGGSILGTAEIRMFTIIAPVFIVCIAYVLQRTMKLNLKFRKEDEI